MNNNRFTELLNLYLDDKATAEERRELMHLIHQGNHDDTIKEVIDATFVTGEVSHTVDFEASQKILQQIIQEKDARTLTVPRSSARWKWVAAAAILLVSVALGWLRLEKPTVSENEVALHVENLKPVVFSGKQFIRLPDGSTALLNEGSELRYASSFGRQNRAVTLSGEAFFDVRHDTSLPFTVLTGKITTTVLGTAFNVRAYPGQEEIKVTVTRGRVEVKDDQRTLGIITPDQQIAVQTTTNDFVQKTVNADEENAWQSQYLILDDVSLEEAVKTIGNRYKVRITLANEQLKACRISATFLEGETLDQVLTVVSGVIQATFVVLPDGNARIEGQGC